jgi:hypothetical protein
VSSTAGSRAHRTARVAAPVSHAVHLALGTSELASFKVANFPAYEYEMASLHTYSPRSRLAKTAKG